jgi:hypothetical protein
VNLTDDELISIAKKEFEKRGGNMDGGEWSFRVSIDTCNYIVFAEEIPLRPGSHFMVIVSGESRRVLAYLPGA